MLTHPDPDNTPGQTSRLNNGTRSPIQRPIPESHAPRDAPEPDSHCQRTTRPHPTQAPPPPYGVIQHPGRFAQTQDHTELDQPRYIPTQHPKSASQVSIRCQPPTPAPPHAPTEAPRAGRAVAARPASGGDDRDRTDDPLLAKQVLSQLSYAPNPGTTWPPSSDHPIPPHPAANTTGAILANGPTVLVGQGGFEPPTPRLSSVCSNQLSY
jgi:hypothetical protein